MMMFEKGKNLPLCRCSVVQISEMKAFLTPLLQESVKDYKTIQYKWEYHPFWNNGMKAFCRSIADIKSLNQSADVLVDFSTPCVDPMRTFGLGTGNIVLALYGLRLASAVVGADFVFHCTDVESNRTGYTGPYTNAILPLLQGFFSHLKWRASLPMMLRTEIPESGSVCQGMGKCPLQYMAETIRRDLRHMAISLVESDSWIRSNMTFDEVSIHFRCGDVLGVSNKSYGFMKFETYKKRISPNTRSIGIVTQSFDPQFNRKRDQHFTEVCRGIVASLVIYLQNKFPRAVVLVRLPELLCFCHICSVQ